MSRKERNNRYIGRPNWIYKRIIKTSKKWRKSYYLIRNKRTNRLLRRNYKWYWNRIKLFKGKNAKIKHKTADTSFFGSKTHIVMTPEKIIKLNEEKNKKTW